MYKQKQAFTLVELIVVVVILAILSTIWFVAYSLYLKWVRDTNRISQIKSISDWLDLFKLKNNLPLPDEYVEVKVNWMIVAYQWYLWKKIIDTINYSSKWVDPKTWSYFSYYLTKDRINFQLMSYLEDKKNLQANLIDINQTNAEDYSKKYPTVYWKKLWILTDENNTPIQEVSEIKANWYIDLWTTNSWTVYIAHIEDWEELSFSWKILKDKIESLAKESIYWAPKDCAEWFIWVPWDAWFNQKWFCVAQYEMGYKNESWTTLSSVGWTEFNTLKYESGSQIVSMKWRYPIADITYIEAKIACETLWKWYHLITHNEYMSLARNIELVSSNRLNWIIWEWYLSHNWVSWSGSIWWCKDHTWWNTESRNEATKTWPWHNYCDPLRQYTLSNWQKIRDLAWNVWEIVDKESSYNPSLWTGNIGWSAVSDLNISKYWPLISKSTASWIWNITNAGWVNSFVFEYGWSSWDWSRVWIYWLDTQSSGLKHGSVGFRCAK